MSIETACCLLAAVLILVAFAWILTSKRRKRARRIARSFGAGRARE